MTKIRCFLCDRCFFIGYWRKTANACVAFVASALNIKRSSPHSCHKKRSRNETKSARPISCRIWRGGQYCNPCLPNHAVPAIMPGNYTHQQERPTAPVNNSVPEMRNLSFYLSAGPNSFRKNVRVVNIYTVSVVPRWTLRSHQRTTHFMKFRLPEKFSIRFRWRHQGGHVGTTCCLPTLGLWPPFWFWRSSRSLVSHVNKYSIVVNCI